MANKREFKKYTAALGSAVCEDMMMAYYNVKGIDKAAVEEAVAQVIAAIETANANANVFFDKGAKAFESRQVYTAAKKKFFIALFDKIIADFSASIDEAMKKFNAAVPAAVKEENKKAVN